MKRIPQVLSLLAGLAMACPGAGAVPWRFNPPELEDVTLGAPGEDAGFNIRATLDGGYVVAGCMSVPGFGRQMALYKLRPDLSLDPGFGREGRWIFGGRGDDQAVDVIELPGASGGSAGYLVAGYTKQPDGDFAGRQSHGAIDIVLVRLSADGALDPGFGEGGVRLYGGSGDDEVLVHLDNFSEPGDRIAAVPQGFIIAAMTRSKDGDLAGIRGIGTQVSRDLMIFMVDHRGEYHSSFGERGILRLGSTPVARADPREPNDFVFSMKPAPAGDFVAAGYHLGSGLTLADGTAISQGNTGEPLLAEGESRQKHQMDGWVLRFDEHGRLKSSWGDRGLAFVGGTRQEKIYDVAVAPDGGCFVTGRTASWDQQFSRAQPGVDDFDMVLVKLRADGRLDEGFGAKGCVYFGGAAGDQGLRVAADGDRVFWLGQSASIPTELSAHMSAELFRQVILLQLSAKGVTEAAWNLGGLGEEKVGGMTIDRAGRVVITGYRDTSVVVEQEEKEGRGRDMFVMRLTVSDPARKGSGGTRR